ncbi:transposase [Mucisphaera sp.]|uniref:transposase n=1 Tax=Mucisphaera sp. TaxID=2913024 RepID=UPI003D0ED8B0
MWGRLGWWWLQRRREGVRRIEVAGCGRFLTFSCFRRQPLLDAADRRDIVGRQFLQSTRHYGACLHAWVVMPEHVHLLVTTRKEGDVGRVLGSIKRWRSVELIERLRR